MSCIMNGFNSCNNCDNFIKSTSITLSGSALIITIPNEAFNN